MSLPDTDEYWNDVKSNRYKHVFTHIPKFECGHFHVVESYNVKSIDCKACKTILADNTELKLQLDYIYSQKEENRISKIKKGWMKKYPNNPICSLCGFVMIERINTINRNKFYGCSQYPNCKNTKK